MVFLVIDATKHLAKKVALLDMQFCTLATLSGTVIYVKRDTIRGKITRSTLERTKV